MGGSDDMIDKQSSEVHVHNMTQITGITENQSTCQVGESTEAWRLLSQYLPTRDPDSDYWWRLTGRQLAAVVEAAGYSIVNQFEALLFHYHWTVCRTSAVWSGSL